MPSIAYSTEEEWRALRAQHVGASEIGALFGDSPHVTHFELWHRKAGNLPEPDLSSNDRVFWGQTLEPAVAAGVAAKTGWHIQKVRRYITHPAVEGMGASLDYEVVAHERGPGVLEIKTVDGLQYRNWPDGEPPLHYLLQLQHQLAVTGRAWGAIAALIGGNRLEIFEVERRPRTIAAIEAAVADFWRRVRAGETPKPDFSQDGDALAALFRDAAPGTVVDLSSSNRLADLLSRRETAAREKKSAEDALDAINAEVLSLIGDAEVALCGDWKVTAKTVPGGHVEYERKPYRSLRVSKPKAKKEAA